MPWMVRAELPGRSAMAMGRTGFKAAVIIRIKCNNGFCSEVIASNSFSKHLRAIYTIVDPQTMRGLIHI